MAPSARDGDLSLLGLEQFQISGVDECPAAASARHLSEDSGLLQPPERGVHGRGAQP